jgi:hypothetical protein
MTTRERLSAWWQARPGVTRKLIPWLVGIWAVIAALGWVVWDTGWAGLARGTIAALVVGGLCAIWNEWRFGQRKV